MKTFKKITVAVFRLLLLFFPGILSCLAIAADHPLWIAFLAAFGIETVFIMFVAMCYIVAEVAKSDRDKKTPPSA